MKEYSRQFFQRHKLNVIIVGVIIFGLMILLGINGYNDYKITQIKTFDQCVQAGYPIFESYPPQCKTPDGRTLIGIIKQEECTTDSACGNGFYCLEGSCEPFIVDTSCSQDSDCGLINTENRYACCWTGRCEQIDYAEGKWIAVNKEAYDASQKTVCPASPECGPAPQCEVQTIEDQNYSAVCLQNVCIKRPL